MGRPARLSRGRQTARHRLIEQVPISPPPSTVSQRKICCRRRCGSNAVHCGWLGARRRCCFSSRGSPAGRRKSRSTMSARRSSSATSRSSNVNWRRNSATAPSGRSRRDRNREHADVRSRARIPRSCRHAARPGAPDSPTGAALQRQLAESGETTPELRRSEAVTLGELVSTLLALGDTKAALEAAQRARKIMEEVSGADPDNSQWQRDQSIADEELGDVLMATGRREEALTEYRRGLTIRERLAAADPDNTQRQRDLSISYNRIGDVLVTAGRRAEALTEYRKSLAVMQKLTAADPRNTGWQRELTVGHFIDWRRAAGDGAARGGAGGISAKPDDPRKLATADPRQYSVAARPGGQPRRDRRRVESG